MHALTFYVRPLQWTVCKVAGWITPRVYWSRLAGLQLREVPIPPLPSPEWVRLRTVLGGICGSDLAAVFERDHPASILQAFSSFPGVLGHENLAIVDEVGANVTQWRPGDRVVVEPTLSCVPRGIDPVCRHCAEGRFTLCDNFRTGPLPVGSMIGFNSFTGGSWGPYFVAHASQLYRVPDALSDEDALLTDPIAGALHAVLRCPPPESGTVVILGAGLLAIGVAASIRAMNWRCRVVAIVRHETQRERMLRYGADACVLVSRRDNQATRYGKVAREIGGTVVHSRIGHQAYIGGADLVYDCVGNGQSLTDAMKYARAGGMVVEVGTTNISTVDTAPLWFDELTVKGTNGRSFEQYEGERLHTYEVVFRLIQAGRLDLRGLVTHRFPITEYRRAMETIASRGQSGALKVAFVHP
jgi:L-iditol 2-dehydrogenase